MRAVTIFETRNNVCIIPGRRRVIADRSPADGGHHHGGNQLPERAKLMAMRTNGTAAFRCLGWLHSAVKRVVLPAAISDGSPLKRSSGHLCPLAVSGDFTLRIPERLPAICASAPPPKAR